MVFRMLQIAGGHAEQMLGQRAITAGNYIEILSPNEANRRVHDGFCRRTVQASILQSEDIAGNVKGAICRRPSRSSL